MRHKKLKGFAAMSPNKRRAVARKGGKTTAARGTGHTFTSEESREAGKKGKRGRKRLITYKELDYEEPD